MAQKLLRKENNLKFEAKYLILTAIGAILSYIAYLLKFPNSYGLAFSLVFLVLLLRNFKTEKGIQVISYFMVFNVLTLPMLFLTSGISASVALIFLLNVILSGLIAYGLMRQKKYAVYLGAIVFILSIISIVTALISSFSALNTTIQYFLFFFRNFALMAFMISSIIYLLCSKKYFS